MDNIFQTVQDSLVGFFKGLYPAYAVVCEEIPRTEGEPVLEDYICLDIIPTGNTTVGTYFTDHTILVDAAIHNKAESNTGYRAMGAGIVAALLPVFRIGDRAITIPDVGIKTVDRVLHCTFTLAFRESAEEETPYPLMEELDIATQIERT